MKKTLLLCMAIAVWLGCAHSTPGNTLMDPANFATTVEGKQVSLYTLSSGDLTMQVTNYGARVVSLWAPDRNGVHEDVVLGCDSISRYTSTKGERFLGAVVGPYANRIANGRFTLDGKEYTLTKNGKGQTLHGGPKGLDRVVWEVVSATDRKLDLKYVTQAGEAGFPGNISIYMTYELTPANEFIIRYNATTDAPTVVNLSNHSYFNLKGEGNGTILDNILTINASRITPVDSLLIPTGELKPVDATPFDFRTPHTVGERIGADDLQLGHGSGYDHNWVLDRKTDNEIELAATLLEPASGRYMEIWTDQPGLQVYSGNYLSKKGRAGKNGSLQKYREAIVLETQKFPDSPNHPGFPSTVLRPGETYTQTCIYKFTTK